ILEAGRSRHRAVVGTLAADLVADLVQRREHLGREFAGFFEDGFDEIRRRIGEAGEVRVAADVEDVVEDEQGFADRRGVGGHAYLGVSTVLLRVWRGVQRRTTYRAMKRLILAATIALAVPAAAASKTETAVLAGGCFWGMESVFEHVKGVTDVV